MKIAFIINSRLVDSKKIEKKFNAVNSFEFKLSFLPTKHAKHAEELTLNAIESGCKWIVSVGGDGTLNEVINCIIKNNFAQEINVALLPYGTGNDYSLSINTTNDPKKFLKAISNQQTKKVDIGIVTSAIEGIRYFINVADAGLGGEITRKISTSGNPFGKWVYYKAIFTTFFSFKRPRLKITIPNNTFTNEVLTVVIGKGISFGGGYKITYDAKLDDGKFFVVVIGDVSIFTYLLKLPWILTGKQIDHPKIKYLRTSKISLENLSDVDCFLEMDGEPSFACPVEVECIPGVISFLVV